MKPQEFWNCRYKEINIYCQAHLAKVIDDLKRNIDLNEATTDKLIQADCMSSKPKIVPIRDSYKELYKQTETEQTLEEQRNLLK